MKRAKITGQIVPVPCPKCGANDYSLHRSYTTSAKLKAPKGVQVRPDVPFNLITCNKCKFIQGYALVISYNYGGGVFFARNYWEPMMVTPHKRRSGGEISK